MLTHGTKNASTVLKVKDRMENCGKVFAGAPLYLVAIDILSGLPVTQDGLKYVLVVTDYFSKWTEAYALPDAEAITCTQVLYNQLFARFGLRRQLHSDQGKNFESKLFAELCKLAGIYKTRTTSFHPRSDGLTERMNRTILQMLRTSVHDNPIYWPFKLPSILAAYGMNDRAQNNRYYTKHGYAGT